MPRPKSGNPPWDAVAVKLPPWLIAEAERYSDLYHISVSALLREGLIQRIQGQPFAEPSSGITVIPPAALTVFTRLADTLTTAAEELRKMCQPAREEGHNGYTSPVPAPQEPPTERHFSGTTVISRAPEAEVRMDHVGGQPPPEKAAIVSDTNTSLPETAQPRRPGRPGIMRQRILTILEAHPEGVHAVEIRTYLNLEPGKRIGDVLQGMRRNGVVTTQGKGEAVRYFASPQATIA